MVTGGNEETINAISTEISDMIPNT